MQERKLKLTPINPFTPIQGQIIEFRANGLTNQEIAEELNVTCRAVVKEISDNPSGSIFGRIEEITGSRPERYVWIIPLIGDVLLISQDEKQ